MKAQILAGALLIAATGTAFAADAVVEEVTVSVAPVFVWTGGYVGLQAGYGWGDSDTLFTEGYFPTDPDGFLGGLYAGYNYQFTNGIVAGVDADITYSNQDGSSIGYSTEGVPLPTESSSIDINWSGAIRGRLGYAVDRFLPYLAAGIAFADVDHTVSNFIGTESYSGTLTGWTVGAGLDFAATDNLIVRAEYRYTDFGSDDYPSTLVSAPHEVDLENHEIRFGVAYKF